MVYAMHLNDAFAPYLVPGLEWKSKAANETYGLAADGDVIPQNRCHSTAPKGATLELTLGLIVNQCPIIDR